MIRTLRYMLPQLGKMLLSFLILGAVGIVFVFLGVPQAEMHSAAKLFCEFCMLLVPFFSTAYFTGFYSSYGLLALGMGSTRKEYFGGLQLVKLAMGILNSVIAAVLAVAAAFVFNGGAALTDMSVYVTLLCVALAGSTLGEAIGISCLRFGKVGMILYVLLCGCFGGVIGLLMSASEDALNLAGIVSSALVPSAVSVLPSIGGAGIITVMNWLLFRKVAVKA